MNLNRILDKAGLDWLDPVEPRVRGPGLGRFLAIQKTLDDFLNIMAQLILQIL